MLGLRVDLRVDLRVGLRVSVGLGGGGKVSLLRLELRLTFFTFGLGESGSRTAWQFSPFGSMSMREGDSSPSFLCGATGGKSVDMEVTEVERPPWFGRPRFLGLEGALFLLPERTGGDSPWGRIGEWVLFGGERKLMA